MFERITEKTFDEIFPLLESAFPVTELRVQEDQRALLGEPCYRLYGGNLCDMGNRGFFVY